jgi:AraC family transcriptional regulator of adaptative response/methylated-DNA-[protein]-cysteine methyltransferase
MREASRPEASDLEASDLDYTIRNTDLGLLLVAATRRGVCLLRFGEREAGLLAELAREFPFAVPRRADARLAGWSGVIVDYVDGRSTSVEVPLDVRGSCFQRRVWKQLAEIPRGETRTYADVAVAIGVPGGARAVARACAANPVPVVVPCHRVIEKSGRPGGYNGGSRRKLRLLRKESALAVEPANGGGRPPRELAEPAP